MEENDGVDVVLSDVLSLASSSDTGPASTCSGLTLDDVQVKDLGTARKVIVEKEGDKKGKGKPPEKA
jgi:hypothetical protein